MSSPARKTKNRKFTQKKDRLMSRTPESIIIDGVEYTPTGSAEPTERQIVVADRGFVFVGNAATDDAGTVTLTNASVIRRWGTTKGLGQLAMSGKTDKTVLDACGTVRVPAGSVVATFNVTPGVSL